MLTIYWVCFAAGGIFVLLAVLGGLDEIDLGDPDFFDLHLDTDLEISDPGEGPARSPGASHRPQFGPFLLGILTSLKFWTFGACFFGLTGLVLSRLSGDLALGWVVLAAIGVGVFCGAFVSGMLRILRRRQTDSLVRSQDLAGLTGTVEIPFDKTSRGKVRLMVKGSMVDFIAYTDDPNPLHIGDRVLVVGIENNRVWVVSNNSLDPSVEPSNRE